MAKNIINHQHSSLHGALICLTALFILTQATLFFIHLSVTELVDALAGVSIFLQFMHPVILIPLMTYLFLQLSAYLLLVVWVWFMAKSLEHLFGLHSTVTYWLGITLWCLACLSLLALNAFYFPASFFAHLFNDAGITRSVSARLCLACVGSLAATTLLAYINFFWYRCHLKMGSLILLVILLSLAAQVHDRFSKVTPILNHTTQPNIILIGLDSLRPDFTSYFNSNSLPTPNIDNFLRSGHTYSNTYTPLARTFPAWISILTGKHPLHHGARNNLINPTKPLAQDNLARRLRQAGYETIYASDEKRFSNITPNYGFDSLIGPSMGVHDFLLGGLTDFPINNLLASSAIGRYLFPYNYGNRAASITYESSQFLQQLQAGLKTRSNKPLFLSIHLCLTHWPFSWASDPQQPDDRLADQYHRSVEQTDHDFGKIMTLLNNNGLLENSIVVLLSDHGTSLGLPDDRIISKKSFIGDQTKLKLLTVSKLSKHPSATDGEDDFSINTAYGQGTNVLSLKQYHVILSFKRFGGRLPLKDQVQPTSLYDIAPTVLSLLSLPPIRDTDGASLTKPLPPRALMIETGDSFSEIETDQIHIEKVIKHEIGAYQIDPATGLLRMDDIVANAILKNKQLAILQDGWMLAHFPAMERTKLTRSKQKAGQFTLEKYTLPPYFVLVNLKSGKWTIGFDTPFAKQAPSKKLLGQLRGFYQGEV